MARLARQLPGGWTVSTQVMVGAAVVLAVSGCTEETPAPAEVTPAAWASYEHVYDKADACGEFSQEQAQSVLGVDTELLVTDVDDRKSVYGEAVYATCTFSNPDNHENQIAYTRGRLQSQAVNYKLPPVIFTRARELYKNAENRSPYNEKYPGFGVHTKMDQLGHQAAIWLCGNKTLHASFRSTNEENKSRSTLLWKQLESTIAKQCGTPDAPATLLANAKGVRIDATALYSENALMEVPTLAASRSGSAPVTVPQPNPSFTETIRHHSQVRTCPMLSTSHVGKIVGIPPNRLTTFGYAGDVSPWDGDTMVCTATARNGSGRSTKIIRVQSEPDTASGGVQRAEKLALLHSDPDKRSPYFGKYHGFGVLESRKDGPSGHVVTWVCRNLKTKFAMDTSVAQREVSAADMWNLAEPVIKRQCGPVNWPQTVMADQAGRRVNYTKLLMEDWKIGSEAQLTSPPAVKRYKVADARSD